MPGVPRPRLQVVGSRPVKISGRVAGAGRRRQSLLGCGAPEADGSVAGSAVTAAATGARRGAGTHAAAGGALGPTALESTHRHQPFGADAAAIRATHRFVGTEHQGFKLLLAITALVFVDGHDEPRLLLAEITITSVRWLSRCNLIPRAAGCNPWPLAGTGCVRGASRQGVQCRAVCRGPNFRISCQRLTAPLQAQTLLTTPALTCPPESHRFAPAHRRPPV